MATSSVVALVAFGLPARAQTTNDEAAAVQSDQSAAQSTAPSADPASGGDIVVTATRQSETLNRVPISVAAYSKERMDQQGVREVSDIARLTPGLRLNLVATPASPQATNISLRGIDSTVGAATTGIYVNDTPIQVRVVGNSATNAYPQVFDLDRVEVLRGPQGTLFGAGAEGGAVRFITPKPDLQDFDLYSRTEVATTRNGGLSYEGGVAVGLPIVEDMLGLRISGNYRRDGGYVDRVNPVTGAMVDDNSNWQRSWSVRAALAFAPTDTLTITPAVFYQNQRINDTPLFFEALSDRSEGRFVNGKQLAQPYNDRFVLPTLDIEWNAGPVTITSNTSYFDRVQSQTADYSNYLGALLVGSPFTGAANGYRLGEVSIANQVNRQRNFTQEFRVQSANTDAPLTWVLGVFYSRAKQESDQDNLEPSLNAVLQRVRGVTVAQRFGGVGLYQGLYSFYARIRSVDEQKSVFGQVDLKVTDTLKLTAGARYGEVKFDFNRAAIGPIAGGSISVAGSQKERPFTPKLGVSWQIDPNNLLYASASKGFRIGGAQPAVSTLCQSQLASIGLTDAPTSYGSDSVWSYEVGTKNRLMGGAVSIDASVYHIKWNDIQRRVPLASCGSGFITNLGSATSEGFDLAFQLRPTRNFSFGAAVGYNNARFDQNIAGVLPGTLLAVEGEKLGGAPWTVALNSQLDFDLADKRGYARIDYQFLSDAPNPSPRAIGYDPNILPAQTFSQVSLRIGARFDPVDVSLFVNNLLNESPRLIRTHDAVGSPLYYQSTLRPRTIGLTGTVRY